MNHSMGSQVLGQTQKSEMGTGLHVGRQSMGPHRRKDDEELDAGADIVELRQARRVTRHDWSIGMTHAAHARPEQVRALDLVQPSQRSQGGRAGG